MTPSRCRCLALGLLALAGCASPLSDDWVARRPLARDLPTHEPSRLSAEAEDPVPPPAPGGEVTLRLALELAMLASPELAPAAWERHAAGARVVQASLPPNPTVGFMLENAGGTAPFNGLNGSESTLRISQVIETAGKRRERIALAQADRQRVLWDYEARRLDVAGQAAQRFIEVLAGQARLGLAKETLDLTNRTLRIVEERTKSGLAPGLDLDRAKVRLAAERIASDRAARQLDTARHRLAAMWGGPPRFVQAAGDLAAIGGAPSFASLEASLSRNPQVARFAAEIAQRRAAMDLARAKAAPDLTGSLGVRHMNEGDDTSFLLELSVPLPLFDRNQGGVLESRFNLAKARSEQAAAETALRSALAQACNELAASHHEAAVLRDEAQPAAQEAHAAVKRSYEAGKATYLEVLDAERTLVEVRLGLINAQAAYHTSLAAVEALIGEPLETRVGQQPRSSDLH